GAEGAAFPTIVASGPNSALPHAQPGSRRLGWGDFVVIDCGAKWQGYCADLTRTFVVGEPSAKQQEIYQLVLDAQLVGLEALQAGMGARELDATARSVIGAAGYADAFGHGLGHGVGLEVHEEPRLSPKGEGELAAGMVVTVEPGIYLAGWGGVRIEDLVLVKEDGREILSKTKKELVSVG
ncbi:MAG TPA: M24 family metallopeptidase, partial [Bacillota bacterium]|nr:M24 family metallopeptidase [Bacillota bacterium]